MTGKISTDFDGVLCDRKGIPRNGNWRECEPVPDSLEAIKFLTTKYVVYISTNRPQKEWIDIKEWLEGYGFPKMTVTNKKLPDTIAYIDDRAIRFENNWLSICKYFG